MICEHKSNKTDNIIITTTVELWVQRASSKILSYYDIILWGQ